MRTGPKVWAAGYGASDRADDEGSCVAYAVNPDSHRRTLHPPPALSSASLDGVAVQVQCDSVRGTQWLGVSLDRSGHGRSWGFRYCALISPLFS